MPKLFAILACIVTLTFAGCGSPPKSVEYRPASNQTILLVSADNMNASIKPDDLNTLMLREVSEFCEALAKKLESAGRRVSRKKFTTASSRDIASAIAEMQDKPGILIQAYWRQGTDKSLYIVANALRINYRTSASQSVKFDSLEEKQYLSIGLNAKPTDTPQTHAAEFSSFLISAAP